MTSPSVDDIDGPCYEALAALSTCGGYGCMTSVGTVIGELVEHLACAELVERFFCKDIVACNNPAWRVIAQQSVWQQRLRTLRWSERDDRQH